MPKAKHTTLLEARAKFGGEDPHDKAIILEETNVDGERHDDQQGHASSVVPELNALLEGDVPFTVTGKHSGKADEAIFSKSIDAGVVDDAFEIIKKAHGNFHKSFPRR